MRESMIHDLYCGNFCPYERERTRSQEYHTTTEKITNIDAYFKNLLSSEEYAKLVEMQDLQAEIEFMEEADLFEYAFCAGAQLMMDIFTYPKQ